MKTTHDTDKWTILLIDSASASAVPSGSHFRVLQRPRAEHAETMRNLFVLCAASELEKVSVLVSAVNRRHHLRALFVRQDANPEWLPQLFDRANLHLLRNILVHSDVGVPRRVLTAWKYDAQRQLIANATVVDDRLFVISCDMETFEVPFDSLPSLRRIPAEGRAAFELAVDGSYIHWPSRDVHLDMEAFRSTVDPNWADECSAKRLAHDESYGSAIAELRRRRGLRQSDVAGLSERHVRRIESGEPISAAALRFMAAAHEMELTEYLDALANVSASLAAERRAELRTV